VPASLHPTVPHGFRSISRNPAGSSALSKGICPNTRLGRSTEFADSPTTDNLTSEGTLSPDLIERAIKQVVDGGLFTPDQLRSTAAPRRVSRLVRQFVPAGKGWKEPRAIARRGHSAAQNTVTNKKASQRKGLTRLYLENEGWSAVRQSISSAKVGCWRSLTMPVVRSPLAGPGAYTETSHGIQ